ncbi:MAG: hypothetical protein IKG23_08525 [Clostridia bacterium]|nr:hypothetical protein [Clostridia bacterium]
MAVDKLTLTQVRDFVIVLLAIMAFIVLLGNTIKVFRDWSSPAMNEAEWRRGVDASLKDNTERIDTLEAGNKVICKALLAIMSHEINGNSTDKLQKAMNDLNEYLIDK